MGSHFEMMVSYLTADELTADVRLYSQWRGGAPLGREAFIVLDSGGVFTEGPWKPWELGFIGIADVQTLGAEGVNIPPIAPQAIPR
jgi:FMN-dependent NADH-azoreductase